MYDTTEALDLWKKHIKEEVNCCLPARVVAVNGDGSVDVVAIRNDDVPDCVITVPVIRTETQRAYIELAIKAGDKGVVRFCDKSIERYRLTGNEEHDKDDRNHSLSDGLFELGFLPENERFEFPSGEIVIGLKNNKFTLSVDDSGNLQITSAKADISADSSTVVLTGTSSLTSKDLTVSAESATITAETTVNGGVLVNGSLGSTECATGTVVVGLQTLTFVNGVLVSIV